VRQRGEPRLVSTVAVAVRGPGSNSDSSPNMSDGTHDRQHVLAAVRGPAADLDLAGQHDEQRVALLALGEDGLAAV
jgi:hypothetical protein